MFAAALFVLQLVGVVFVWYTVYIGNYYSLQATETGAGSYTY